MWYVSNLYVCMYVNCVTGTAAAAVGGDAGYVAADETGTDVLAYPW